MAFAADLEADCVIRNMGRTHGVLMRWPDVKSTGVASMRAAGLNARLLGLTADWWVQMTREPSAIPIDLLRGEVWDA